MKTIKWKCKTQDNTYEIEVIDSTFDFTWDDDTGAEIRFIN